MGVVASRGTRAAVARGRREVTGQGTGQVPEGLGHPLPTVRRGGATKPAKPGAPARCPKAARSERLVLGAMEQLWCTWFFSKNLN